MVKKQNTKTNMQTTKQYTNTQIRVHTYLSSFCFLQIYEQSGWGKCNGMEE